MNDDQTPINARPKRQRPEALEDLSLALRDRLLWPLEDRFVTLSGKGRTAVAGGAVVLALGIGVGTYALASSGGSESTTTPQVAAVVEPAPQPAPPEPQPEPAPEPTLQGAAPVIEAPEAGEPSRVAGSKAVKAGASAATASNTGNAATDTISSAPTAQPAAAEASASSSPLSSPAAAPKVEGPPAGPAALAVARKFAAAFVVYETGGEKSQVRKGFAATATPELARALIQRPPLQPAGIEVPKAKVLNVVPAPSHDRIYPVSVSLLRVGSTSELRLEMEQLKNKQWRVANVLG
ncbi:MAG TPA: hypothetical protein VD761_05585 [Solirubrobacterales bacterium]|nr:hypothetical protein [Solirubrobacterales bacterium]